MRGNLQIHRILPKTRPRAELVAHLAAGAAVEASPQNFTGQHTVNGGMVKYTNAHCTIARHGTGVRVKINLTFDHNSGQLQAGQTPQPLKLHHNTSVHKLHPLPDTAMGCLFGSKTRPCQCLSLIGPGGRRFPPCSVQPIRASLWCMHMYGQKGIRSAPPSP